MNRVTLFLALGLTRAMFGQVTVIDAKAKPNVSVNDLTELIQRQQRDNVRESYGTGANQCFTDVDLARFKAVNRPGQIAAALKHSPQFISLMFVLKRLPADDRNLLLASLRRPLHPTWAEINEISRRGQTEAGQQAEKLIADAIVDLAVDLVKLPTNELERLER